MNANQSVTAVWLSILLYVLFVLVPLLPAIAIYKIFPKTKVGLKGPLQDLQVNASGAFAAYLIVAIVGIFLVNNASTLIRGLASETAEVTSKIVLLDENDKPLPDDQIDHLFDLIQPRITPPHEIITKNSVRITLPMKDAPGAIIQYILRDFTTGQADVTAGMRTGERTFDAGTIRMRRVTQPYEPASAAFPQLEPLH